MSATNSQELRELIQGPGDVEWRYANLPLCFPNPVRTEVVEAQVRHATPVPGDPAWPPARPLPSLQGPKLPQGARHLAHVRVLPSSETPSAQNSEFLSSLSFGRPALRVCIRDVKEAFSVRPRFLGSFEYLVLDVQDSEEQNLIRLFPTFVL